MKKIRLFLTLFLVTTLSLAGCKKTEECNVLKPKQFTFPTQYKVVEVTPDTKSFRIEIEFYEPIYENELTEEPHIILDRTNTTAKHNVHFINNTSSSFIGTFSKESLVKWYRDVEIIPENITEEVRIGYFNNSVDSDYPKDVICNFIVILKPAIQE